jgi:hypothetical protein
MEPSSPHSIIRQRQHLDSVAITRQRLDQWAAEVPKDPSRIDRHQDVHAALHRYRIFIADAGLAFSRCSRVKFGSAKHELETM